MKRMIHENQEAKNITNRTRKKVTIIHMDDILVPIKHGMKISSHKDLKKLFKVNKCCVCLF
jgi:hypothetical protein